MAILTLYGVFFHEPANLDNYLYVPWSQSDEEHDVTILQQINVQGRSRVLTRPGRRDSYNYTFQGIDMATIAALGARAGRLQYLRDSRGVAEFGKFGPWPVRRWPNPRIGDVTITFLVTDRAYGLEDVA